MMKGCVCLQPLQAKAISASSRRLHKTLFDLCPTMAVLFVLVLLVVAKNGDGMRGSPETASMIETEVTLWEEDPCAQFGAKKQSGWSNTCCQCPNELPVPRNCEGRYGRTFDLKKTISSDCHCEEDPCAQFGAEQKSWRQPNICQCPKKLPFPRNCEGTSGRTFDVNKTIEEGSDCHCEDPCAQFGAVLNGDLCDCPSDRPRNTKECNDDGNYFRPSKATEPCRCLSEVEALERRKMPVAASALRFCSALAEQSYQNVPGAEQNRDYHMEEDMQKALEKTIISRVAEKKTSTEICQHALTGTITPQEAEEFPFAEKASELSQKGSDEDQDGDRAYGRMRAVKEDGTSPTETALWEHALSQVCKDECDDLLKMMEKETWNLAIDVTGHDVPFAQACAERVVQHVEAEILGCCGRSCGFDGRRCLLWPFFSPKEKVDWEVECCAEISILKNSSRELMCNSVLSSRLAKEASQYDLNEQAGADIGKVLIGQNTSLFWTEKGAQESALGKEAKAHGGEKVNMDFLLEHKDVGEEYLRLGYFREEPFSKIFDGGASSVMEVNLQDDRTCDFGKLQQQCPKNFHNTYMKTCKKSWKVTQVSEGSEDPEGNMFHDLALHPEEGNCTESSSQSVATPEECESLTTNSFGEIFLHYFTYDTENKEKPIKCFTLGKNQCEGKDQWWTMIPLVSVQELLKKEDVNAFTELVYVKVKAD